MTTHIASAPNCSAVNDSDPGPGWTARCKERSRSGSDLARSWANASALCHLQ